MSSNLPDAELECGKNADFPSFTGVKVTGRYRHPTLPKFINAARAIKYAKFHQPREKGKKFSGSGLNGRIWLG